MSVDTCVMCGDIVPEDTHVCIRCQKGGGCLCPDCGTILTPMQSYFDVRGRDIVWTNFFNCKNCGADWQKESRYIGEPVKFQRKIWG